MLFGQPGQKIAPAEDAPERPKSFDRMDLTLEGIDLQLRTFQQRKQVIEADRNWSAERKGQFLEKVRREENDARPRLAEKMLNDADKIVKDLQSTLRTKRLFAKANELENANPAEVAQYQNALAGGLLQNYTNVGELATEYEIASPAFKRALQMSPAAVDQRWTGPQYQRDKDRFKDKLRADFRKEDPEVEAAAEELGAFRMVYSSRTRHMLNSLIPPSVMFSNKEYYNRWNEIFGEDAAEGYTQGVFG